jgi:uncharacterized phage protein (TIGR02218 family)
VRTISGTLATHLAGNVFLLGDLFEITVRGTVYYLTGREVDISWGGHTYVSTGALLARSRVRQGADGTLDDLDVRVMHGGTATLGGVTWVARYMAQDFAGAAFKLRRAYFSASTTVVDTVLLFDGFVGPAQFSSTEGRMVVRSLASRLETPLPRNLYQPQCGANLYDSICGLTRPTTWDAATTAAGSTTAVVKMSSVTQAANYFKLGMVEFLSGALSGLSRTITGSAQNGAHQDLTISPPLPSAPATSVTIKVRRGCDKVATTCDGYGRLVSYLGAPMAPRQDQVS